MAQNKAQIEKEYQEVLKVSSSMLSDLTKLMDDNAKAIDKKSKGQKRFNDEIKQSLSGISSYDDISQQVLKTEDSFNKLKKDRRRTENGSLGLARIQKDIVIKTLKTEQRRGELISIANDSATDLADNMGSFIDDIQKSMGPFGKLLNKPFENLKSTIGLSAKQFVGSFGNALKDGKTGMQALSIAGRQAFGTFLKLVNPFTLLALAIGIGVVRFKELDAAAKTFRDNTGLLVSQTTSLKGNIQTISRDMAVLGVSAEDVAKSAADFSNEFDGIEQPSQAVLGSMVMLNKNFGIGTAEAAKLNKVFQNIGGLSAEQSQALIGQTAEMAKMAGVAPNKVIKDMADNSEVAYQFFGGSTKELAKAAVEAAAMGTSIAEAGKAARGLLDYQSSIGNELEASAILGTNINLSQARYLAANDDILGSQQAIIDEVGKLGDLTKLNVWEQDALVAATGMEFSSLVNQQRIRERFGKLKKEELAAAQSLIDSGKDISKITSDDLKNQTRRMESQREMQSLFENMSNEIGSIKTAFFDAFAPLASFILPVISGVISMISGILVPALRVVGSVLGFILSPVIAMAEGFKSIMESIFQAKDTLMVFGGVFATLLAMKERTFILDKLSLGYEIAKNTAVSAYNGIIAIGNAIKKQGLLASIAEMAMRAFSSLSAIPVIGPVLGIAAAAGAAALGYSYFSKAGDVDSPADGKTRISTKEGGLYELSPNDDFIAAPGLSDVMNGGIVDSNTSSAINSTPASVNIDISGVINELKDLKTAFMSNKNVYIDGDDVTAKVTMRQESSSKNEFGMEKS